MTFTQNVPCGEGDPSPHAWKARDRGLEPRSDIQVSKKQNVSSLIIRKDSILWGASVTEK